MPDRSAIRDWVRQQTLVEVDDFSNDKLNLALDQGIREIAAMQPWPFLQAESSFLTTEDEQSYPLPSDFSTLEAVYYEGGDPLPESTRRAAVREFNDQTAETAEAFYFWMEELTLVPTPSTPFIPVYMDYQREPILLTNDTQEPEFHSSFHMILAEYAASKVWEREEDLERATFHYGQFLRGVAAMNIHYTNRGADDPIIIGDGTARVYYPYGWQLG